MKNYSHPKLTPISVPGRSLHSDLASQDGCAVMPEAAGSFEIAVMFVTVCLGLLST